MKSPVYFTPMDSKEELPLIHSKLDAIFKACNLAACFADNDLVAIKLHFGEDKNITHIPATYLSPFVDNIKKANAKPFLTDTNVLYKSRRSDSVSHLTLANEHGFTLEQCGAPVIIADGLIGDGEIDIAIKGKIFKKVSIAKEVVNSNALLVLTHFTGHIGTGFGGALKNLGMGLSSRKGKLRQHSTMKPNVNKNLCTGCEQCTLWCPANAIEMLGDIAAINNKICIGCGECLTVCRFDAIKYNWKISTADLQKKIAEHALGAVINKKNKVGYINFITNITKDCDCFNVVQKPLIPDIGILASKDPVALDKASVDIIKQYSGKHIKEMAYPDIDDSVQLSHAVEIGLGSTEYELIEL